MIYILVIWTVVGFGASNGYVHKEYDWRPIGEFTSGHGLKAEERCHIAAKKLGVASDRYRCVERA